VGPKKNCLLTSHPHVPEKGYFSQFHVPPAI
jgi:hypothetical protein